MKLSKVAKWEFCKTFKSKRFLVMTFLIPVLMGAFGGFPILIEHLSADRAREIAVIDETDEIYAELVQRLADTPLQLVKRGEDQETLRAQLKAGGFDGLLVIGSDIDQTNRVSFYARDPD